METTDEPDDATNEHALHKTYGSGAMAIELPNSLFGMASLEVLLMNLLTSNASEHVLYDVIEGLPDILLSDLPDPLGRMNDADFRRTLLCCDALSDLARTLEHHCAAEAVKRMANQ